MSGWIDYKKLKETTNIQTVLDHYHIELKTKGKQATGFCPLPTHEGEGNSPSFSVNLTKGIFRCFGCGAKGNVIDLVAFKEGLNPADKKEFRQAAQRLQEISGGITTKGPDKRSKTKGSRKQSEPVTNDVLINAPLDFELKGLDSNHPYLLDRGFTEKTIEHFGLGYCSRGYMRGRIAIPLHDAKGDLIGYAGRIVDDSKIDRDNPRYLFPAPRERDGKQFEFKKSLFLYNGFSLDTKVDELIVVEGFTHVWWLWQSGYENVVALMGACCSEIQAQLIVKATPRWGTVNIMSDGDQAGLRCAHELLESVSPHRAVRWIKLDEGKQPTDYDPDQLDTMIDPKE